MTMKLYYSPNSPYARKCRVLIAEHGMSAQLVQVEVDTAALPPELLATNPLGKIPALEVSDNFTLCESPVICEYLDAVSGKPSFYPKEQQQRFHALGLTALADGLMDAAVDIVYQLRRPEEKRWPDLIARREAAIHRTIGTIAKEYERDASIHIGHIAAAVALEYISFRLPNLAWQSQYTHLVRRIDPLVTRPSFVSTRPA